MNLALPAIEIWLLRIIGVIIILLPNLNINSGKLVYITPSLDLAIIFFWTIANVSVFNQYVLIILGIYADIITGLPLGFNSLIYLVFYYSLLGLRRYFINTSFYAFWLGFLLFSFCFLISKYLLVSFYYGEFFIPRYLAMQWIVLLLIYPLIHSIFSKIRISCYE
jgi:cell shape-determining protein MreD